MPKTYEAVSTRKAKEHPKEPVYHEPVMRIAEQILSELDDSKTTLEQAGHISLAILLTKYAKGDLPSKEGFSLLKTLADKKTPAPVQRIEQRSIIDMRVLINEALETNSSKLEEAKVNARERKEEVMERYNMDESLELKVPSESLELPPATDRSGQFASENTCGYRGSEVPQENTATLPPPIPLSNVPQEIVRLIEK